MTVDLESQREAYTHHINASEAAIEHGEPDAKEANRHIDAIRVLVAEWDKEEITADVLLPLLDDERPAIRCGAARQLLFRGHEERPLSILESMKKDKTATPTTKSDARRALRLWRAREA